VIDCRPLEKFALQAADRPADRVVADLGLVASASAASGRLPDHAQQVRNMPSTEAGAALDYRV
jgi:hypothetical protein